MDLGPGAGKEGGKLVVNGTYEQLLKNKDSLTAAYLSGRREIPIPEDRVSPDNDRWITIRGARQNNLQDIDVKIPLGCVVAVIVCFRTEILPGGGDTCARTTTREPRIRFHPERWTRYFRPLEQVDKAIVTDQSPIAGPQDRTLQHIPAPLDR